MQAEAGAEAVPGGNKGTFTTDGMALRFGHVHAHVAPLDRLAIGLRERFGGGQRPPKPFVQRMHCKLQAGGLPWSLTTSKGR